MKFSSGPCSVDFVCNLVSLSLEVSIPLFFIPSIYIYIYIVIHRQTVSFYQNSSVWLDTQDALSRDRNPSNFTLDKVSDLSATKQTTLAKETFKVFILVAAAAAVFVYVSYTLSATRVLNSFEELCITLAAADNSFARVLNPHVFFCFFFVDYYKV